MIQQFNPFQPVFWDSQDFDWILHVLIKIPFPNEHRNQPSLLFFLILRQFFFIDSGRQFLQVLSSCHKILLCENDQDSPALLLTISYTRSLQCSGIVNLHCELAWKIYICLQNPPSGRARLNTGSKCYASDRLLFCTFTETLFPSLLLTQRPMPQPIGCGFCRMG